MPLTVLAAKHAFYNLGMTWLKKFAKHYSIGFDPAASLFKLLLACVKKFLPKASDQELLKILSARVMTDKNTDDEFSWGDSETHATQS